jgi:hypothetical protein
VFHTHAVQFDPETLTEIGKVELGVAQSEPQWVRMKLALAGGGIYANGPTSAYTVNATADTSGFAAGGNATNLLSDLWAGWNASAPALALGGNAKLAATVWPRADSDEQGANASKLPLIGIFLKGHNVSVGRHASLRITPRNQDLWLSLQPRAFFHFELGALVENRDERGNRYATIGGGPGLNHERSNDYVVSCTTHQLTNAVGFSSDVTIPADDLEPLKYDPSREDVIIAHLFELDGNYQDNLPYCFDPQLFPQTYNSNSYVSGLLRAASLPPPLTPSAFLNRYRGWTKSVPSAEFHSGQ